MKKAISFLLALVMALSLLPAAVWAEGGDAGGESVFIYKEVEIYTLYTDNKLGYSGENLDGLSVVTNGGGGESVQVLCEADATSMTVYLKPQTEETICIPEDCNVSTTEALGESGIYKLTTTNVTTNTPVLVFSGETKRAEIDLLFCKRGQSGGEDNPDQGGINDCIATYDALEYDEGNVEKAAKCIITGLRDTNREQIELAVSWREELSEVRTVGFPQGIVEELAEATKTGNREVVLYHCGGVQFTLSHAVLSDIAEKLVEINKGKTKAQELFWVIVDYVNRDEQNGAAYAVRVSFKLGDNNYTADSGNRISVRMDREVVMDENNNNNPYSGYALYCPNEDNTKLVKQEGMGFQANKFKPDDMDCDMMKFTFSVQSGGMFVMSPDGYSLEGKESFWGGKEPAWEPGEGSTPANAPENLRTLYDAGFKFPTIDINGATVNADIHFTFPETLKAWEEGCGDDWDYRLIEEENTGTIRIQVNMGDRGRWEQTVRGNDGVLDDGVFFRYYFGNSDNRKPMSYGFDWYGGYSKDESLSMESYELREQYNHNNGLHLASVNRVNAYSSVLTLNSEGEDWRIILAMDNEQKAMKDAACKYALRLVIEPCESTSFTLSADNGTAVEKDRITIVENSVHSDWKAFVPADGTVFLRSNKQDRGDAGTYQYGIIAKMNAEAKAGYTLQRWINSAGPEGNQLPVSLVKDDYQTIRLIWKDADGNIVTEYIRVECHNKAEWFRSLGSGTNPQVSIFTNEELAELEENGIHVTYAEDIGYFAVSVDASKLTNVDLLQKQIYLTHPEGAVYFKGYMPGGSENPATHDVSDSVGRAKEIFDNKDMIAARISEYGDPSMSLVQVKELRLGGLTVYYTDFQMYRNLIVQWLDGAKEVIGYSYVYGRNGDLSMSVRTDIKSELEDGEKVDVPTLVTNRDDLRFTCDKNPQTGSEDGRKLFLQFDVSGDYGDSAVIYLPYSMFGDLRWETAKDMPAPTVTHYLDNTCRTFETIIGEYTENGVKFTTKSFSPFVIDCSAAGDDDTRTTRYYRSSGTAAGEKVDAASTGDAGIAVYAVMALGSCTGAAALAFRRKRED